MIRATSTDYIVPSVYFVYICREEARVELSSPWEEKSLLLDREEKRDISLIEAQGKRRRVDLVNVLFFHSFFRPSHFGDSRDLIRFATNFTARTKVPIGVS